MCKRRNLLLKCTTNMLNQISYGSYEFLIDACKTKIPIIVSLGMTDIKQSDEIVEYEPIVVGTYSMSKVEWKKTYKFAVFMQTLHVLGLLQAISIIIRHEYGISYSNFFESLIHYGENNKQSFLNKELNIIEGLLNGIIKEEGNWGSYVEGFEKISWPPEEAMFLRVIENFESFYDEVYNVLISFFSSFT